MRADERESACLWCGHTEFYRPANRASVSRCKARMATHELHCPRSPIVKENALLRKANADMTRLLQQKKGNRVIDQYLNPRKKIKRPSAALEELGSTARATVLDDDVVVYVDRVNPEACVRCSHDNPLNIPLRVITPRSTIIGLMCEPCLREKLPPRETAKALLERADRGHFESAFLFEEAGRIKMIWGDTLQCETIR
jgi:hypothetical protein